MRKKILFAVMAVAVLGAVTLVSCKGSGPSGTPILQEKCPVMGDPITNRNHFVDYQGKRIYFCCAGCPDEFKKDPEKYMKQLDPEKLENAPAGN